MAEMWHQHVPKTRALAAASLSVQRSAGDSNRGLEQNAAPGLGKEQHIRTSRICNLQCPSEQWCLERSFLNAALGALTLLREATQQWRCFTAKSVASTRDVVEIAFSTALLRWPDRTQASGYLVGFKFVGEIPASGLSRQIPCQKFV